MTELLQSPASSIQSRKSVQNQRVGKMVRLSYTDSSEIEYVDHPDFEQADIEEQLWGSDAHVVEVPQYSLVPEVVTHPSLGRHARTSLTAREERVLFKRYNYAKYRLRTLLEAKGPRRRAKMWQRRAEEARCLLVHANLALVPTMAKRVKASHIDFEEFIAEGNMTVLRCIEKFDVSRGFKFSTYACRSLLACFHRLVAKAKRLNQVFPVEYDPELERSDFPERRHEQQRSDSLETVRRIVCQNRAHLSELEHKIVLERFMHLNRPKPQTLAEISKVVSLSKERVRQILNEALVKIRESFQEQYNN